MTVFQIIGMGVISVLASTFIGIRGSLKLSGLMLIIFFVIGFIWLKNKKLESVANVKREEYYFKHSIKELE